MGKHKFKSPQDKEKTSAKQDNDEQSWAFVKPSAVKASGKRKHAAEDSAPTTTGVSDAIESKKRKQLPSKDAPVVVDKTTNGSESTGIKMKKQKVNPEKKPAASNQLSVTRKPEPVANEENPHDENVSKKAKKAKSDGNLISAGCTIEEVVGIKLKRKKPNREKKREKHVAMQEEQKKKAKEKEILDIKQYLECWSTNRDQWKFHKLRQIYIQERIFEEDKIDNEIWPIALEYLSGTKGSSKDVLMKRAETIIREGDAVAAADGDETLQACSKYERAREVLQCMG